MVANKGSYMYSRYVSLPSLEMPVYLSNATFLQLIQASLVQWPVVSDATAQLTKLLDRLRRPLPESKSVRD